MIATEAQVGMRPAHEYLFLLIAFRLFLAVEGAINQIWKVRSARGYRQKIIAFTMLFFWGPVLMGLSFTTTSMLERNRSKGRA